MARLDIERTLRDSWDTFWDDPVDFVILGLLSGVVPSVIAIAILFAFWGTGAFALVGASGAGFE